MIKRVIVSSFCLVTALSVAQAQPAKGHKVDLGIMTIRPYAEATLGYDSNVFANSAEDGDAFAALRLGLQQEKEVGIFELKGDLFYYIERYQDLQDADSEDIGFDLDIDTAGGKELGDRAKIAFYLGADFNDSQELDYETGEIEDSRTLSLNLGAGKTVGRTDLDLTYDYITKSFGDKSRTFNKSIRRVTVFDYDEHILGVRVAPRISDKTHGIFLAEYHIQDSDGSGEDGTYIDLKVGLNHKVSEKTSLYGAVGYLDHDEGDIQSVSFDLSAMHDLTNKLSFEVFGNNRVTPSAISPDNYVLVTEVGGEVTLLMTDRVAINGGLSWLNHDTELPVVLRAADGVSEVDLAPQSFESDTISAFVRLVYAIPKESINLFLEGELDTRDSSIADNDFDRYIGTAGIILFY